MLPGLDGLAIVKTIRAAGARALRVQLGTHGLVHELGLDPVVRTAAGQATLRRGIEESNVPFCAPMQLYHGLVSELAAEATDYLFLPMLRQLPHAAEVGEVPADHLRLPAARLAVAGIHLVKVAGEEGRLFAPGAGADLEHGTARVGRILGEDKQLQPAFGAA